MTPNEYEKLRAEFSAALKNLPPHVFEQARRLYQAGAPLTHLSPVDRTPLIQILDARR